MKIDLEELLKEKLIDSETAYRIKTYYSQKPLDSSSNLLQIISLVGIVLVSLGILIIIGYNWDQIPNYLQVVLSILPLITSQIIGIYTLIKNKDSTRWHEIAATSILFGVGIAMALIAQIYNMEGTNRDFVKWWLILSIPLIYIFRSGFTSLLVWVGIGWYLIADSFQKEMDILLWGGSFIILASIRYISECRHKVSSLSWSWHHWIVPLIVVTFTLLVSPYSCERFMLHHFSLLFLLFSVIPKLAWVKESRWIDAYSVYAILGAFSIAFIFSFKSIWTSVNIKSWSECMHASAWPYSLVFSLGVGAFIFYISRSKTIVWNQLVDIRWIILLVMLISLVGFELGTLSRILVNIVLIISIALILYKGVQDEKLGVLNFGLVLLVVWIICRFFETDWPTVWKGISFILLGFVCFGFNYLLIKRKKS